MIPSKSLDSSREYFQFYCPTTKGSVSSPKKLLGQNSQQKNSDSIRQRCRIRLSEQPGGRVPPSLAPLGLLQSLKYTQKRQTYSCLLKCHSQHPLQKEQK